MAEPGTPVAAIVPAAEVKSLLKAAVIDDAFDDEVVADEISLTAFREFYQTVNEDGVFEAILKKLEIKAPIFSEWEDDATLLLSFLQGMWKLKDNKDLEPFLKTIFATKLQNLEELESLVRNIERQNISVIRFKSNIKDSDLVTFKEGGFVYVFIDYNLGTIAGPAAIKNAQGAFKKIYEACPLDDKPVTILMSSNESVANEKTKFQRDSGILEGAFRFSSKAELKDENKISLLVRAYHEDFKGHHKLQEYIQALTNAASKAQEEFADEVRTLRVEDYEFIQNSVLQAEKHPLGDYLAWLYGSHWATLLLKNVELKNKQDEIDKLIATESPLHHDLPSPKLAEIFMNALFETNLDEVKFHPWQGKDNELSKFPYLHLGDVFTKAGDSTVFMILNPQCDLERPGKDDAELSILIAPGKLQNLEPEPIKGPKTDFFIFGDTQFRINWELRHLTTIALKDFEKWQTDKGLQRKHRLRLPYALELQQVLTSSISRVGLPVAPPLSNGVPLEVKYKNYKNEIVSLVTRGQGYAFLPVHRNVKPGKPELRLTLKLALDFKGALVIEHDKLVKEKNTVGTGDMPPNLEKSIAKISKFVEGFDNWFFTHRKLDYPKEATKTVKASGDVAVTQGFVGEPDLSQAKFWINLVTTSEALNAETAPVAIGSLAESIVVESQGLKQDEGISTEPL